MVTVNDTILYPFSDVLKVYQSGLYEELFRLLFSSNLPTCLIIYLLPISSSFVSRNELVSEWLEYEEA